MTQPRRSARKRTQIKYEDNDNNDEEQQIVDNEIDDVDVDVDGRKKRRRKTKSSSEKEKSTKSTKRDKRTKSTRKRIQKVADDADADDDDEEYVNVDYNENEALDDVISVDDEYDDTVEIDDDDDDDGDELVEEDDDLKTPKRKKRYRGKGRKSTSGSKKQRNYGSIEERTCPFCKKVFSIVTGLGECLHICTRKRQYLLFVCLSTVANLLFFSFQPIILVSTGLILSIIDYACKSNSNFAFIIFPSLITTS